MKEVKTKMERFKTSVPLVFMALILSSSTFAMDVDAEKECKTISKEIIQILDSNSVINIDCQADVLASGVFVKNASLHIKNRQYQKAVLALLRSEEFLQATQIAKERCSYFAPILKPYIPKVKALKAALDKEVEQY